MNSTDIFQKIKESYQNNHQRLIEFFQNHGYDEQQAEELYTDGKLMDKKLWKMDGNLKNYRITDSLLVVDYFKLVEIDEYIPVKPPYEINIYAHDVMWYNVIIDDSVNSTGFLSVDDSISFSFDNSLFLRVSDIDGALFLNNETVKAFRFRNHPTDFIFFNEYDEVHIIKYNQM